MRSVLGLFEGVVSGAADGYARAWLNRQRARCFASAQVSANGPANLHNAYRARVPIVNLFCAIHIVIEGAFQLK